MPSSKPADAVRLAQHMRHDARAVEKLALELDKLLTQRYECRGGTDYSVVYIPPGVGAFALLLAVLWRRRGARLAAEARYDKIY